MDYEKKNKQLHTLISDLYPFMSEYCKEKVEGFFPELKKSEDERIRKWLIDDVKDTISTGNMPKYYEDMAYKAIDWLEKQDEPSIKWNKNTEGNKPQINHSVLMKTIHGIVEGEWKGEHWLQYRWSSSLKDSDVLSWIELSNLEKQGEQKASYTTIVETGDGGINALVTRELPIEMKSAEESLGIDSETYNKIVDECIYGDDKQKPAWSEEDECYMAECINAIATKDGWLFEEKRKTKHWLKSLKDKYTWKPSDEQIKALHDLNLTGNISYAGQGQTLIELYNNLKNLKG